MPKQRVKPGEEVTQADRPARVPTSGETTVFEQDPFVEPTEKLTPTSFDPFPPAAIVSHAAIERVLEPIPTVMLRRRGTDSRLEALKEHRRRAATWSHREGRFELFGAIGSGRFSDVRLAEYEDPFGAARLVVLKRLPQAFEGDAARRAMLLEETRTTRLLEHQNLVRFADAGSIDGAPYLALQYVDGVTAGELDDLSGPSRLSIAAVLELGIQIARGLHFAHEVEGRLVHCDVSPDNIIITREGRAVLVDFGIARTARSRAMAPGLVVGNHLYMSPEQLEAKPLDRRADLFALGLVIAEMIGDQRLLKVGAANQRALPHVIREACARVAGVAPELPALLARTTAASREERPKSAGEVADELERILRGVKKREGKKMVRLAEQVDATAFRHLSPIRSPLARA